MSLEVGKIYPGKKHDHILVLGTGPSVFYNLPVIQKYVEQYSPTIVGINGCFYGLHALSGKTHTCVDPNGAPVKIDAANITSVLPHILFSFLLRRDKNTVHGSRIDNDKDRGNSSDLFKYFILRRKGAIIRNRTALLCPSDRSCKINHVRKAYGWKKYGQAKWDYDKYFEFDVFPPGYKKGKKGFGLKRAVSIADIYDGSIKFRPGHGGEYVLSWVAAQSPKTIAISGMCDFPNGEKNSLTRGWFWLNKKRVMPPRMASLQSVILDLISNVYQDRFHNLNWENRYSWK